MNKNMAYRVMKIVNDIVDLAGELRNEVENQVQDERGNETPRPFPTDYLKQ